MIQTSKIQDSNVRIFEYGVRLDPECIPLVGDQIQKARQLYNELVACIRLIVTEQQAFVLDCSGDDARKLDQEIAVLTEQFLVARAKQDEASMKQIAQERYQKRSDLWKMLAAARKTHKQEIQSRFWSRIGKRTECDTYKTRCDAVASGLGWATANEILDNALDAFKRTITKGQAPSFSVGADKMQDSLSLQFTSAGGVPCKKLFYPNTGELSLAKPKTGKYGEFRFRLGAAKDDVYATGTWKKHRDIPEGASVGLARLVRRKIGNDYKFYIQLQAKLPTVEPVFSTKNPLVALHLGWAKDGNTRNIAGIADCADPGMAEILQLPEHIEQMLCKSSSTQARRDVALNELAANIKLWDPAGMTEEIIAEIQAIKKIRLEYLSQSRLHRLCWMIKRAELFVPVWLEEWRKQDKMDWQEVAHVARRARNSRKTFYSETAKRLAANYAAILIVKPDLKNTAKLVDEDTGTKTQFTKKARAGRVVAGVYEFDQAIRHAFSKAGGALLDMEGEPTASQCSICGGEVKYVKDEPDTVCCSGCGAVLNKKQNGAANGFQLAIPFAQEKTAEYHIEARKVISEKSIKQREKLEKLTEKRNQNRIAKQSDQTPA